MTPQLQQAIKLLQLSNVELAEYCEQELERNPLLERDDGPLPKPEREQPQAGSSNPKRSMTALAREDFSKVADLDSARRKICTTPRRRSRRRRAESAPLTDWTTVKSGNASKATKIFWNPPSLAAARSRII